MLKMNRCFTYSRLLRVKKEIRIRRNVILGIETSCDDTGAAVIDLSGKLLGESISTQKSARFGGVIPTVAMYLHRDNIAGVVSQALQQAEKTMSDVTAVAVTNRPGLKGPLIIGTDYAKYLCKKHDKPMIPVHHMAAHALTVRMEEDVQFPFMILLISGGHSILGIAKDVDDFLILGSSLDNSPGEALDKIARRLKVHTFPGMRDISGGQAIEILAKDGDFNKEVFSVPLRADRSCDFSFSGFKGCLDGLIRKIEEKEGKVGLSKERISDICAAAQYGVSKHLCERLQRGIEYSTFMELMPNNGTLVVSGGVASNMFIRSCIQRVCSQLGYRSVFPRPKLCTDNGIMIGWTGLEMWRRGKDIVAADQCLAVDVFPKFPLGQNISDEVIKTNIKCKWIKIV